MQREIKFRTWDTKNKEFSEWTNRDPFFSTSENKIFFWERTKDEKGNYCGDIILEDYGNRFILSQFTGLKDINNKEIYEGDILKVITHGDWLDSDEYTNNIEVKFGYKKFGECDGSGWIYIPENREIVGNIFETPELLAA